MVNWVQNARKCVPNVELRLTPDGVSWSFSETGIKKQVSLYTRQILTTKLTKGENNSVLDIHYVAYIPGKHENVTLKKAVETFVGKNEIVADFQRDLEKLISVKESHRPKRWLVLINPVSGRGASKKCFHRTVVPILDLCGITYQAVETRDEFHADEILANCDISSIDAVVGVGGDGMTGQVTSAVMRRSMADANVDIDDRNCPFVKAVVTVGIIPTGSVNLISYSLTSAHDAVSNTLSIVLGNRKLSDTMTCHDSSRFLRHSNVDVTIGPLCHIAIFLEKIRFLYWLRYIVMFFIVIFYWTCKPIKIYYKEVPENKREFHLEPEAYSEEHDWTKKDFSNSGWKTHVTDCFLVNAIALKLGNIFKQIGSGRYLDFDLVSGKIILCATYNPKYRDFMKQLFTFLSKGRTYVKNCDIQHIEVEELIIEPLEFWYSPGTTKYPITFDGDPYWLEGQTKFYIRVNKACLSYFCVDKEMVMDALNFAQRVQK